MDGQNMQNGQDIQDGQNMQNEQNMQDRHGEQHDHTAQYSYYQDNTANMPLYMPVEEPPEASYVTNGLQIASLVCGIVGIVLGCCCIPYGFAVGIVLGIIGIVLAIVGNKQSRSGIGTGGLVCSIVALVIAVIMLILIFIVVMLFGTTNSDLMRMEYYY